MFNQKTKVLLGTITVLTVSMFELPVSAVFAGEQNVSVDQSIEDQGVEFNGSELKEFAEQLDDVELLSGTELKAQEKKVQDIITNSNLSEEESEKYLNELDKF